MQVTGTLFCTVFLLKTRDLVQVTNYGSVSITGASQWYVKVSNDLIFPSLTFNVISLLCWVNSP